MSLVIRDLACQYGQRIALAGINLDVAPGELLVLLGPSGSGKTTLLSLLAGILTPSRGEIRVGDRMLSRPTHVVPPEQRQIGFVFQDFALWPHMTVAETIGFPLRMQRMAPRARRERVETVLELVHLSGYGGRYPHELSGGQRQRVAIARALAPKPQLVLLDEPMSNLDAKLRERMRVELADVLRHEGVTAIYVTHDRTEALALADRIAIIDDGRLIQVDTPDAVYHRPATVFAAGFIGPVTLLPARPVSWAGPDRVLIEVAEGIRTVVPGRAARAVPARGTWVIRPESVQVLDNAPTPDGQTVVMPARLRASTYAGSHWQWDLALSDDVAMTCHHGSPGERGQSVMVSVDVTHTWFVEEAGALDSPSPGALDILRPSAEVAMMAPSSSRDHS